MNKNSEIIGHILGLITAVIWGVTLISTKILLQDFKPVEILFFRFLLAVFAFYAIYPHKMPKTTKKQEFLIALSGLFGICLYYLFENMALIYTYASNVGVINCCAPFFTAILTLFVMKNKESLNFNFLIGFLVAITGVSMIIFNGSKIHLNPLGDFLVILAAISWAFYSVLIKKITSFGFSTLLITRKAFLYGIVFMIPMLFLFHFEWNLSRFQNRIYLLNILFLGLLASAVCFVMWNKTIKILGAMKGSAYIYLIPVVTLITSAVILKEQMSFLLITGAFLTLLGLFISQKK